MSTAEFNGAFSGVALVFEPGPQFETGSSAQPNLRSCLQGLLRTPGTIAILPATDSTGVASFANRGLRVASATKELIDLLAGPVGFFVCLQSSDSNRPRTDPWCLLRLSFHARR